MSRGEAAAYCGWLAEQTGFGYRLPSEAEWEYAARAGTTTRYAFGDSLSVAQAKFNFEDSASQTVAVGSYPGNNWGIHDMHGNVWEWVEDQQKHDPLRTPGDGSAWNDGSYHASGKHIVRGGSWFNPVTLLHSASRYENVSGDRSKYIGFRCARDRSY